MAYLIPYNHDLAIDPDVVGQKFASLAHAARKGFAVPAGASISTEAHRHFYLHRTWPQGLLEEVRAFSIVLGLHHGLSIRSSAVREDLDTQSFAGQYQTFLRIYDAEDLRLKIEKCWLSAEADTVRSYLQASRGDEENVGEIPLMGVILQRMIEAKVAGVAFGRNPVNSIKDEIVIEAVSGSGEPLMNGHVSPYRAFIGGNGGFRFESPTENAEKVTAGNEIPLTNHDWQRIAELLRRLEAATGGKYLDMEWAIDTAGKPWLLQYRRITTVDEIDSKAPRGLWTRRIADDLWADRLTPFLADAMVKNAHRYNLSRALKLLNIPVVRPTLSVINGYLYVNCDAIGRIVAYVPRRFRTADMRAFFPTAFDFNALPQPGAFSLVLAGIGGLVLPIFEPAVNPLICLWQIRRHWKNIERRISDNRRLPAQTLIEARQKVRAALETMTLIQEKNQWPYFHAAFFTLFLRWMIVDLCGASHTAYLDVISSDGQNVSIDIERHFRQMVATVLEDTELTKLFLDRDPGELYASLPPYFKAALQRFLDLYGCRSRHRTLYIRRWAEAPEEVVGILQTLIRQSATSAGKTNGDSGTGVDRGRHVVPKSTLSEADSKRDPAAVSDLSEHQAGLCRLVKPVIRKMARRFLDSREDLRFLLDKALFEIRRALLLLGEISGLGDDILFLSDHEIDEVVFGSLELSQAKAIAAERHRHFQQPTTASSFIIDGRPMEEFSMSTTVFKGIGTSPGRVSGRARIVSDPSRDPIQKGDILVAQNTDPGWTPILSLAAGMVMEEGGLLNHCSIVARELKIPAIVGIRHATRKIGDGALITIDGGLGLVRVEGPEPI